MLRFQSHPDKVFTAILKESIELMIDEINDTVSFANSEEEVSENLNPLLPNASKVFDEEGAVGDKLLEERIIDVGKNVARFTFMHSSKEIKKFLDEQKK